uniref:Uncharacterized protein n=1 Tax=Oryza brachyantha TaxID=4533 RepID=J3LZV7_ORYBR
MSNQSANMTLGITGACGRTAANPAPAPAAGSVRQLESSADDDSTGSDESELAGCSATARSCPVSLLFGLPVTSAGSADFLAGACVPSTRFLSVQVHYGFLFLPREHAVLQPRPQVIDPSQPATLAVTLQPCMEGKFRQQFSPDKVHLTKHQKHSNKLHRS